MPRSFAEARGFTPSIKLRKDMIQKDLMIEVELFQWNKDVLNLALGTFTQGGYTAAGFTGDLMWLGSDQPQQGFNAYLISSELTDGTPFKIAMWQGLITTEDSAIALSGTEHATVKANIEGFNHPNFTATGLGAQKHYGLLWFDLT